MGLLVTLVINLLTCEYAGGWSPPMVITSVSDMGTAQLYRTALGGLFPYFHLGFGSF